MYMSVALPCLRMSTVMMLYMTLNTRYEDTNRGALAQWSAGGENGSGKEDETADETVDETADETAPSMMEL